MPVDLRPCGYGRGDRRLEPFLAMREGSRARRSCRSPAVAAAGVAHQSMTVVPAHPFLFAKR